MIRAIDELGYTVDYVRATRWIHALSGDLWLDTPDGETVAIVPGHWILKEIPSHELDPGEASRD